MSPHLLSRTPLPSLPYPASTPRDTKKGHSPSPSPGVGCTFLYTKENGYEEYLWILRAIPGGLEHTLGHHGAGHLHEACHVGTLHIVDIAVSLSAVLHTLGVDVAHDLLKLIVDLLLSP